MPVTHRFLVPFARIDATAWLLSCVCHGSSPCFWFEERSLFLKTIMLARAIKVKYTVGALGMWPSFAPQGYGRAQRNNVAEVVKLVICISYK